MQNKSYVFIALLSFSAIFMALFASLSTRQHSPSSTKTLTKAVIRENSILADKPVVNIDGKKIYVEIADTPQTRKRGLSGREKLGENEGMLFDFGVEDTHPAFWMIDMNFNIDIIWIDNGKIVGIEENVPAPNPNTPDSQLPLYRPSQAIDYVLEVNAGYSHRNGVEVGDTVDLSNL